MALTPKMRSFLLVTAMGLTLAAVFMAPPPEVEAIETVAPTLPRNSHKAAETNFPDDGIPNIVITRNSDGTPVDDPFQSRVPQAAPPPTQEALLPPPAPSAPSLPYAYLGKMEEDGKTVAFLGKQDNNYSVRIGETIDGLYRLEEISDQSITLVYLPLDKKQMLPIGRDVN
jgi:hypothetical protein